ncbi:transcriptional regulator, IclR family [Anaerosphaera aminiphila DSM 21120]|uniref:Transcriptional regulator, IclR family n=1 Tax=Anaerosphaera aminiphila DSM 21120 TaxID=1120995 RepID=A0A1M5TPS7_9FIRM|nr:IclR family transcriptional regulator [Anaerosphaera aminiphila]SHH52691.1 transcriptional regulator, IclR family [Anaerosphaera aminiphila DSM 21120]
MELIKRTLRVLESLSHAENGLSVSEVAKDIDISSSSAHRILKCLTEQSYAYQEKDTKRYFIGYKVLTLCQNITQENSLIQISKPYIRELRDELNKTIALCVRKNDTIICIDYADAGDASMYYVRTGFSMPIHSTSAGKILCSYLDRDKVFDLLKNTNSTQNTPFTITNAKDWIKDLDEIQKQGYAICDEELQIGIQGIAVPIFDSQKKAVASISFTSLKSENSINSKNIDILKLYAEKISQILGNNID